MNIGWISQALPYLPSRGGFRLYGGNLIRQLSRRHRVDLVSLLTDDDASHIDWLRQYCDSVQTIETSAQPLAQRLLNLVSSQIQGKHLHYRRQFNDLIERGIREQHWDVIHVEGGYAGGLVDASLPVAKVLSLHDSWTLRCAEMVKSSQSFRETAYYRLLGRYEPRRERLIYPRFERCTVVAQPDVDAVRATVPKARVDLIPYGTDAEYFHPVSVAKEEATLVFHSHLGYSPNIAAALEFANEIFPLVREQIPQAVLHLIGAAPGPSINELATRPGIRISADLPDLRAAVCSGRVYVSAIRYGTGLKSKILEAMAMRMPIVGYPGSTVGIACKHGKNVLVAKDARDFATHVISLLRDPQRAERLSKAARALVEEQYSWESRARMYEDLYERVIEERQAERSPMTARASTIAGHATATADN
jgi:glycosyltransferase involved in cell wall biosynthesis